MSGLRLLSSPSRLGHLSAIPSEGGLVEVQATPPAGQRRHDRPALRGDGDGHAADHPASRTRLREACRKCGISMSGNRCSCWWGRCTVLMYPN